MQLITDFAVDVDIIEVPKMVIDNAEDYQAQFFKWLFNKSIDHAYWWYEDGKKYGCNYRSDAFVEWLNAYPLKDEEEKAFIVSTCLTAYDQALPRLNF